MMSLTKAESVLNKLQEMVDGARIERAILITPEELSTIREGFETLKFALGAADEQSHFNGLTPAEAERLAMMAEECCEVVQACMKIFRHGYESHHPNDPLTSNRVILTEEFADVEAVAVLMNDDFAPIDPFDRVKRKLQYTHHQGVGDDRG